MAPKNATQYLGRDTETTSAADLALAKAFATECHNLEHLSIPYMIGAKQFFTSCQQLSSNRNILQSLTLTSSTLARKAPRQNAYILLRNASLTALNMPQLKSMVLWNSEQGQAYAVVYQRHTAKGTAMLT
jgi:hypothetical protein